MSQSHYQKTLSELIRSRGRPISKPSPVSEGASSSSQSGSSGGSFVLALALALRPLQINSLFPVLDSGIFVCVRAAHPHYFIIIIIH